MDQIYSDEAEQKRIENELDPIYKEIIKELESFDNYLYQYGLDEKFYIDIEI